ncbi:MAG TPA: FUSC family protein [Polyangiaceae bacterium]|jgi:uncharacterized membrane protein YccC|nr:FUSC family protein [Polyangiaceae bacterium]
MTLPVIREAMRMTTAKPDVVAGIRAALAATLPLLLIPVLGSPGLTWTSLGGFNTTIVDKGGAYRVRAAAMSGYAAVAAVCVFTGSLASTRPLLAIPLTLVLVTVLGMLRLFGAAATSVGVSSSVSLVIALAVPSTTVADALHRTAFSLVGSAWAFLFSLLLWPIRPYRPARLAVSSAYRALAALADHLATPAAGVSWESRAHELAVAARLGIETARGTLGALRRGRPGSSLRGEQLVVLLEGADQLLADLVAIEGSLDDRAAGSPEHAAARELAPHIAAGLGELADAIESEAPLADTRPWAPRPIPDGIDPAHARALRRATDQVAELGRTARGLDGSATAPTDTASHLAGPSLGDNLPELLVPRRSPLLILRGNLSSDSAILRHACRASVSTAATVLLTSALHLHRGYWATLTCIVIMQPHGSQTLSKALQRVAGTILGAGVAVLAASVIHDPAAILACVFVFIAIAVALMPINYGIFALFLTPSFVLLAERSSGEPGLPSVRVLNTVLGAAIALAGSRLLFPLSERDGVRPRVAEALRALRQLLDAATGPPADPAVKAARRDAGLALSNADASFQRALTESPRGGQENEALLSLLLYTHRVAAALNGVARAGDAEALATLRRAAPALDAALDDLADAVAGDRPPAPLPNLDALPEGITSDLAVQHVAALRWYAARHA